MSSLLVETDERGCRTFWLDRPKKRNALDERFLSDLLAAATDVNDDENLRLVLIRSTSAIFSAGADLNDWADICPRNAQRLSSLGSRAFQAISNLPVPVVAAVEGSALGGGLELLLACDIRIGSTSCEVGFPEPRLGNSPAWGGMARLVETVGNAHARDMLLTGDNVSAVEAHRIGILQRICAPEDFSSKLNDLVASILACDVGTLTYIKSLFGSSAGIIAAQEAAVAGFTATRAESRERKELFLASRRKQETRS